MQIPYFMYCTLRCQYRDQKWNSKPTVIPNIPITELFRSCVSEQAIHGIETGRTHADIASPPTTLSKVLWYILRLLTAHTRSFNSCGASNKAPKPTKHEKRILQHIKVTVAGSNYRCKLKWPRFGCGLLLPSGKKGYNLSAKGIPI
jgi:hypothetical protein